MPAHRAPRPVRRLTPVAGVVAGLSVACALVSASAAGLAVDTRRVTSISRAETVPTTTCTISAPAADTYTDQTSADANYGGSVELRVAAGSNSNQVKQTFLRFDLTSCAIPPAASVQSAALRLSMVTAPSASRTYGVHRVTAPWDEATLTWTTRPTTATSQTASAPTGTTAGVTLQWDVLTDVQQQVSGTAPNQGWMVRDSGGTTSHEAMFRSREHGTAAQRPSLVITSYR